MIPQVTDAMETHPCAGMEPGTEATWYLYRQTFEMDGKKYEREQGARQPTAPTGHFYSLNRDVRCGECYGDAFRVRGLGYDGARAICVACGAADDVQ